MTMNPVTSSMIARVGYEPELLHLRAVMTGGAVYDVAPCSQAEFAHFMDAPSKGAYWHKVFAGRAYRSGDAKAGDAVTLNSGATAGVSGHDQAPALKLREPAPLHHVEGDPCCASHLRKHIERKGDLAMAVLPWSCPKCGTEWSPRNVEGVFHWEPAAAVLIFKR